MKHHSYGVKEYFFLGLLSDVCLHYLLTSGVPAVEEAIGHIGSYTPHFPPTGPWAATVMLAVACCRRVAIMLHLTPELFFHLSCPDFCSAVDTIVRQISAV